MIKLVSNQLGPNFSLRDAWFSARQIFRRENPSLDFSSFFKTKNYLLTDASRTAIGIIIDKLNLPKEKKIGIPAFICAVVATPFLERGYEISWIDTDANGLINPKDFEKKSDEMGLVVVPHIFGQRAQTAEIAKIAHEKNIFVVEDGAHFFEPGCEIADAKILSFGREKDVSCVSGGALFWAEKWNPLFQGVLLPEPQKMWTIRHLLQPLVLSLSLPWWNIGGKFLAGILSKVGFLPRAVTRAEKSGHEDFLSATMPKAIQNVLMWKLEQRSDELIHRQEIANAWKEILMKLFPKKEIIIPSNYLRVILKTDEAKSIKKRANLIGYDLQEWEGSPIAPEGVVLENFGYTEELCPNAETFAKGYVTFPTNIRTNLSDVENFATLWRKI